MVSVRVPIPAVAYEGVSWETNPSTFAPRKETRWRGVDYQAAIPASLTDLDFASVPIALALANEVDEATDALARFDQHWVSSLAHYGSVLLRSEAVSSSRIENLTASSRKILEAELLGHGSANAEVIASNVEATKTASKFDAISGENIIEMHRVMLVEDQPNIVGKYRDDQVWIGGGSTPHTALFVPPAAHRVETAMADLCEFAQRDNIPPLVLAALVHAQFETIHPFPDGNGRTGRALLQTVLRLNGVVSQSCVPVSTGLLVRRQQYFDALTAFREGDAAPIISVVAQSCVSAVEHASALVAVLDEIREQWREVLSDVRADSRLHSIVDVLITQPVVSADSLRTLLGQADSANVHRYLNDLESRSILVAANDHKSRSRIWRSPQVLEALDLYASTRGRRPTV